MPDPNLSEAIREAYASSPVDVVILHTLELLHPAFTQPVRVVRNHSDQATWTALGGEPVEAVLNALDEDTRRMVGLVARLEDSAPANPGELVPWIAMAFEIDDLPEINTGAAPEATVTIDNVGEEVAAQIERAATGTEDIQVIYRAYLSTDIDGPQSDPPMRLILRDVTATDFQISGTARFPDVGNRAFPNEVYTARRFRGLAAST